MIILNNEYEKKQYLIPYNLHFFDEGEKTEQATQRKKEKAREEGQVAKSQEVGTAILLVGVFSGLKVFSGGMFENMLSIYRYSFSLLTEFDNYFNETFITGLIAYMFSQILLISTPILAIALGLGIFSNVIQVGWHPTSKPLMPKFSKLDPIKGFKRIFSMRALVDLVKALAKFIVICIAIYIMVKDEIQIIPQLPRMELLEGVQYVGNLIVSLGLNIGILFVFIALADYIYNRYKHGKDLRMSKQEVKEEYKQVEGNPLIKGKIRQRMREASMRRMMQEVPKADVIITNPTHYAVALKYDKDKGEAPIVIAKGVDFLAKKIKEKAKENKVEIFEDVQLARTLYATVDIGKEIPPELYQAVAEVLAFVYKLRNRL